MTFALPPRDPQEVNVVQQGPEWVAAHLGRLSSRHAARLITTGKPCPLDENQINHVRAFYKPRDKQYGQKALAEKLGVSADLIKRVAASTGPVITSNLSEQRKDVMAELLAEWALGEPFEKWLGNSATDRGLELEDEALARFTLKTDREWRPVGCVFRDESQTCLGSPDGLVGDDECVELKCPESPGTHLAYLFRGEVPKKYRPQCQWHHWITGRSVTFMSYFPGLPPLIVPVEIDAGYQAALDEFVPQFLAEMEAGKGRLLELGVRPA